MSEFRPEDDLSHLQPRGAKTDPILLKALEDNDDEAFERRMEELRVIAASRKQEPSFTPFRRFLKALHLA